MKLIRAEEVDQHDNEVEDDDNAATIDGVDEEEASDGNDVKDGKSDILTGNQTNFNFETAFIFFKKYGLKNRFLSPWKIHATSHILHVQVSKYL